MARSMGGPTLTGAPLPPEVQDAIIKAMAQKALQGDTRAAAIVLEYSRQAAGNSQQAIDEINAQILSLADLINNPLPNRTLEDIEAGAE